MIEIKDLNISFDGKKVIDGVNLSVTEGDTLVMLGKNGSGKSVILKTIAGLINEYSGSIFINGADITEFFHDRGTGKKQSLDDFRLAYVFQKGGLFDSMTVFDNVAFGLRRMGVDEEKVEELVLNTLQRVGLKGNEYKVPVELSGGMQKRVGLARAVCLNPNIILYDDPTAGLDPILSDSIADLILEIEQSYNTTSIVVTQDLKVARKISRNIALLYGGKIVYTAKGDDFFMGSDSYAKQFIEGEMEGPIDIF